MSLSNENVAHEWAHGRSGRGGNTSATVQTELHNRKQVQVGLYFSYETIIGVNIGGDAYILSGDSYSNTTCRHQSHAIRAIGYENPNKISIEGLTCMDWGRSWCGLDEFTGQIVSAICSNVEKAAGRYAKASDRAWKQKQEIAANMIHYLDLSEQILGGEVLDMLKFSAKERAQLRKIIKTFTAFKTDAANAVTEWRRKQDEQRKRREREQRIKDKKQFADFIDGKTCVCPSSYKSGAQYLSLYQFTHFDGFRPEVVTSLGVRVPVADAIKGFKFYFGRCINGGDKFKPWHRNGEQFQVERWSLEAITEDGGVVIGCHRFHAEEIKRFLNRWMEELEVGTYLPTSWFEPPYGMGVKARQAPSGIHQGHRFKS